MLLPVEQSVSVGGANAVVQSARLADFDVDPCMGLFVGRLDSSADRRLTTHGYGEQFLKVDTQEAERSNRPVAGPAIKIITSRDESELSIGHETH